MPMTGKVKSISGRADGIERPPRLGKSAWQLNLYLRKNIHRCGGKIINLCLQLRLGSTQMRLSRGDITLAQLIGVGKIDSLL